MREEAHDDDQLNEGEGHEGQGEGHSVNRQLQYFGTTRSPKRRPPYPPRPSLKQKKQVKTEGSPGFQIFHQDFLIMYSGYLLRYLVNE